MMKPRREANHKLRDQHMPFKYMYRPDHTDPLLLQAFQRISNLYLSLQCLRQGRFIVSCPSSMKMQLILSLGPLGKDTTCLT